ncbi:MAG: endonuclease/exonuclease/phosphatase family protein [Acutalibacteraceae bacterium]|nr:endonuclease/exonuclease/phosphatase family protein [Acutalibacteraceae bacterium]
MKIMTFNIQHALDFKNKIIDTDLFAGAIKKHSIDICGLNEVRGEGPLEGYTDQTNAIADALKYEKYFAKAVMVDGTSPYGNALVSRYPVISAETVPISRVIFKSPFSYHEPRCVLKSVIDIKGKKICVMVCHMGLSGGERKMAVKTICKLVDSTDLPVIVTGDFNTSPDDKVLSPLFGRMKNVNASEPTYPSNKPEIKIDYIFYRGLECIYSETVNEIYADHLPVVAEFNI